MSSIKKNEIHYFVYGCDQLKTEILYEIKSAIHAEESGKSPEEYLIEKNASYLIDDIKNNLTISFTSAIYMILRDRVINFDYENVENIVDDFPF